MKTETIRVKILEDGITAKEVNKIPKPISGYYDNKDEADNAAWHAAKGEWQQAEAALRTFEIEATPIFNEDDAVAEYPKWIPGSVWNAVIISYGSGTIKPTVKILD